MVTIGFSSLKRGVALSAMVCGVLSGCASTMQQTSQAELSPAQNNVPHPKTDSTAVADASTPGVAAQGAATTVAAAQAQPQVAASGMQAAALAKSGRIQPENGQQIVQQHEAGVQQDMVVIQQGQIQPGQIQAAQGRLTQVAAAQPQANQGQAAIAAVTGATSAPSASAAYAASDEPPVPDMVVLPTPNPSRPDEFAMMQPIATQSVIEMTPEMVAIQSVIPTPRPGETLMPATELAFAAPTQAPSATAAPGFAAAYPATRQRYDFNFDTSGPTVVPAVLTYENDASAVSPEEKSHISKLIQKYAAIYEVPAELIHRVVHRESRYNPKAYSSGYFGLMQIKYNTAKSMGYEGAPAGLFDAETNIKYAAKYLRGAWMVADSKQDDAVALYARGYYYDAKRKGMTDIANGDY